ncbi:2-oxo-Delta(3)-4,5,5-trimethylcyclopentenylacetyl-CoA monooxygenase [Photorhabdus australis subsp. thailandensis]|uniref:2-oxo-Delta(3)-4,5, 5-trimethylcyclopentenylacetyl-CoA monooxygenase n=1 Tax=Photorhabdus australis subsp. thailandensis TaxID=2805096 RepID=A0A1C0TY50_9GAMM|nr:NAD(P)-binding domain-containing protein [Photorhabdus australis]OCQ50597.1 2-oxo-Delta(3)-4,5,5-trimethylcyclopentenylacetyl-CoA monooxygenase [Photorhabdus australis subsp. thailandensis]
MRNHYPNIIIGGGPAGLNMALEFSKRGIEYLLLEANETVGGQWDRFPVCGELISLNKKYVPGDNHTYRMRYDWHTLSTIDAEDVARDPKLRFTEWTSAHWPSAKLYKEYLKYVADKMELTKCIHTNMRVRRIMKENERFIIEISDSLHISADRIFCATGVSKPIVPDIKGLNAETCTFYENFDPNTAAEHYRNKIVVVLGRGNSAFEIAHHLIDITAETRVVTRSLPLFARQTHNVHDLRAQVSDVFDLMQLKSNNNIVSDRIVEIRRIANGQHKGQLLVSYETPCLHWSPPRWMKRTGIVDDVIVCCGFNYTLSDIFDMDTVRPDVDGKGKYCLLTSSWESVNIPGLYFIGAPMRVNDPDAASGFVHGFRCNIQALGNIIAEKYHGIALKPIFEYRIPLNNPSDALVSLSKFLVDLVSTSMPLFELFSYFGNIVTFEECDDASVVCARVWPPFSREYNNERWGNKQNRLEVVFEYGFHRYGNGELPTHYFTLPADHFDTSQSAYIHPVFHVFREGVEVSAFHMQESLIGRWDIDDYVDTETNVDQYRNVAFNACACALGIEERRSMLPVLDEFVEKCYPLMNEEEIAEALRIQPTLALLAKQS